MSGRRLLVFFVILILFRPGYSLAYEKEIKGISSTITERIVKSGKKTIAVVDFTGLQGNVTELGRFLAEELSVELVNAASGFSVIDRAHLKSILAEHKLSISGIADPKAVKKLGQIAGVDAIITGSVTPLENSIRVTAKVIATDTANVIGAAKCDITKTRAIEELLSKGIDTGQTAATSAYTPSYVPSSQSKKVDNMVITVKKILILKDRITVMLDFFNQSDNELMLAVPWNKIPELIDDKGNIFRFAEGVHKAEYPDQYVQWEALASTNLNKSNNDVALHFTAGNRNIAIKDIGSNFTLYLKYLLYDVERQRFSIWGVSFTDIKAQMPK